MTKDDDHHKQSASFLGGLLLRCAAVHRVVRDPLVRENVGAATFVQVVRVAPRAPPPADAGVGGA